MTPASGAAAGSLLLPVSAGYVPPPRAAEAFPDYPFLVPLEDQTYAPEGAYLGTHDGDPDDVPLRNPA